MENDSNSWTTNREYFEHNRFKAYGKKHPRETDSCFTNLKKLVERLNICGNPALIKLGFLRPEGKDIWRIGQTKMQHSAETRLYVYLYVHGRTVYQLTIGDKKQQPDDLRRCAEIVKKIKGNQ